MDDLNQGGTTDAPPENGHPGIEHVARALCLANGDDPDAMAYPPMMHCQAKKSHVIYVPVQEHHQPQPCWFWYVRDADIAISAWREVNADLRP
jgi:hypothetical protein